MGVAAARHDKPTDPATFANDESPIRGESRPATAHPAFLHSAGLRQKTRELLFEAVEHFPVWHHGRRLCIQPVLARVCLHRFRLPAAQQQAPFTRTAIQSQFRHAKTWKVRHHALQWNRYKIFMAHRHNRQFQASQFGNVISVGTRSIDNRTTRNHPAIGSHSGHTPAFDHDFLDCSAGGNPNA